MKKIIPFFSFILLTGLCLSGCKKAETSGNTQLNYKFSVVTNVSPIGSSTTNPNIPKANTITWTSGYVNLVQFMFQAQKEGAQINFSYKPKEITKVDFFIPNQIIGGVAIPSGTYKEVQVKVAIKQVAPTAAILINGTFVTNGGAEVPVELSLTESNDDMEFGIKAKDLVVNSKTAYTGVVKLRLDALMKGVTSAELDQAKRTPIGTKNVLVINKDSNPAIYAKIKANVPDFTEIEF